MPLPPKFDHHEAYWAYFESVQNHEAAAILYLADTIRECAAVIGSQGQTGLRADGQSMRFSIDLPPIVIQTKPKRDEEP
jgi:hypothetical protein